MVLAAAYVVMALGLNLIVGFAGLLDLGYVAFFAIGAYTAAYFASGSGVRRVRHAGIHFNFLLILVLAVAATAVAGHADRRADAAAARRLHRGRHARVRRDHRRRSRPTAAAIELFGGTLTSGPIGIGPIDRHRPSVDRPLRSRWTCAPGTGSRSRWSRSCSSSTSTCATRASAARGSRCATTRRPPPAVGIPIVRTKLLAYATGAAFGGISGAFLASYLGVVNAAQFEFSFSIFILAMVVLGGLGSIAGVVRRRDRPLGRQQLPAARRVVRPPEQASGLDFDLSAISSGIYGVILVVVMLLRPQGLVPARRS